MKIGKAVLAGVAAVLLGMAAQAGAEVADRIVAVVNDEIITLSELNNAFEPFRAKIEVSYREADREKAKIETRRLLLNQMINSLLLEQEARKAGITVGDEEVSDAISDVRKTQKLSVEEFRNALEREGITLDAYRKNIRDEIMRIKLIRRDIKSRVAVTDEEIGEYYRNHQDDYEGKTSARIRQILLLTPKKADPAERDRIRAEAEAIRKRLVNGESFEALCAKYSQGPAAADGGDIGYI
jgi:peptidyl-prolyl cis-trans isomerase SurA